MRAAIRMTVAGLVVAGFGVLQVATAAATTSIGTAHKFKYVQDTVTVNGGGSSFSDAADCGTGFLAVSGGNLMSGQPSEPRMTGNLTTGTHQTWQSTGFNTGFGKNLTTIGLCRPSTVKVDYVQGKFTLPASPSLAVGQAACPAGETIASGGVRVNGPLSQVHVSGSYPSSSANAWRVAVFNDSGASRPFTVFASCVPPGFGLTYSSFSQPEGVTPTGIDVDIPCSGSTVPISGGISWGGNQRQVQIASSGPIDSGGGASTIPDVAWRVGASNNAGASKTLKSYAVCAPA